MSKCTFTNEADQDLIDIYLDGLEKYGVRQAEAYQDILAAKLHLLADNPSFGADYGDLRSALRRAESVAHSIYYRAADNGILVLRILYKTMDPGRHLHAYSANKKGEVYPYAKTSAYRNVNITFPENCGLFVLDIDGEHGLAALEALEKEHAPLPQTWESVTGLHCILS